MTSALSARRFNCIDCARRCRCLPMHVIVTNAHLGPAKHLVLDLELCPSCKVAWIDRHLAPRGSRRRGLHEVFQRDARLKPSDFEDLTTVRQWQRT